MIGETFGNYRLVGRIGSGTMGTVFLGEHERIARRAAIKVLAPELAVATDLLDRFFDEARATSLIQHPAIVEVLDCGIHPDGRRPYIVMQFVEGETLAARLGRVGALGWRDACVIARQISEGLAAAHRHGIVHRDVKPANVMLVEAPASPALVPGAAPAIKLLDFGVAKLLHDARSKGRTCPGGLLGTPEYMAPEQCGGQGGIDGRTDIYALGCVLFEMVCARLPFDAEMIGDLLLAHRWKDAPAASAFAEVPRPLNRLIATMLAKRPEDRPADMPAVAQTLTGILAPTAATAIVTRRRAVAAHAPHRLRGSRRHPYRTAMATIAAVALLAIAAQLGRAARGRQHGTPAPIVGAPISKPVLAAGPAPLRAETPSVPRTIATAPKRPSPVTASPPQVPRSAPAPRRARSTTSRPDIDTDGIVHL